MLSQSQRGGMGGGRGRREPIFSASFPITREPMKKMAVLSLHASHTGPLPSEGEGHKYKSHPAPKEHQLPQADHVWIEF